MKNFDVFIRIKDSCKLFKIIIVDMILGFFDGKERFQFFCVFVSMGRVMQRGDFCKDQMGNVVIEKVVDGEVICFLLILGQFFILLGFSVFIFIMGLLF